MANARAAGRGSLADGLIGLIPRNSGRGLASLTLDCRSRSRVKATSAYCGRRGTRSRRQSLSIKDKRRTARDVPYVA